MRLFIALNFSQAERNEILQVQRQLKAQCTAGNFTRPENLHLTLAFLGEISPKRIPLLRKILKDTASNAHAFSLSFDRLGNLPGSGREKLWYLGCDAPSELNLLVQALHSHLRKSGFSLENREYLPHVTLGRRCVSETAVNTGFPPVTARFSGLELMLSEQINGVLTYTEIFSAKLKNVDAP